MQIPMPTPQANSIKSEQIVITTIHSDVMPKMFSSIGAKCDESRAGWADDKSRHHHKFHLTPLVPYLRIKFQWLHPIHPHNDLHYHITSLDGYRIPSLYSESLYRNALQEKEAEKICSGHRLFAKQRINFTRQKSAKIELTFIIHHASLLPSLIAVITSLKLLSVPQPSVTYFNVM